MLVNFIALLGWSPGGDREKMTLAEMCELFTADRIGKTNARFDRDKLLSFNTDALVAAELPRKLAGFKDYLGANPPGPLSGLNEATLTRLLEINPTARIFREIEEKSAILFEPDERIRYDEAALKKWLLKGERVGIRVLEDMRTALAEVVDFKPQTLETLIREYGEKHEMGLGKVAQPLRIAVTGATVSPPIFDTLALLGRTRTLARVERLFAYVQEQGL